MADSQPEIDEPINCLVVDNVIRIPTAEFRYTYSRSPGPGGQNVNKVNTQVHLHWDLDASPSLYEAVKDRFRAQYGRRINSKGQVVIWSSRFRVRQKNIDDCLEKLRVLIESVAKPPAIRKKTRRTRASNQRRLDSKKQRASKKQGRRGSFDD